MKKILSLLVLVLGLASLANAQQNVTINTTHSYNVTDEGLTYTWAVTGGTSTDLSTQTGSSVNILWDTPGTYTLSVYGTDANNCRSETTTATITVNAAASVMFANASSNDAVITCSPLLGGAITTNNFDVVFTDGVAPFSLTYEITAIDGSKTTQVVSIGTAGDVSPVTGTLSINDWENTSGVDQVVSIRLVSATTADSGVVTVDPDVADNTRSVTVHPKPSISGAITLN